MPSGATGPLSSETGALVDIVLWRVFVAIVAGEEGRSDQLGIESVGEAEANSGGQEDKGDGWSWKVTKC